MLKNLKHLMESKSLVSVRRDKIDSNKIQGFVLGFSKELVLLQYVYDFHIDGLLIIRSKDITEISSSKTDIFQTQLLKDEDLYKSIPFDHNYKLNNWKSIIPTLGNEFKYIIVEDEDPSYPLFFLGTFKRITSDSIIIHGFSGVANWDDEESEIYFEDISSLQVNTNYINFYKRYYEKQP